ncbi:MAG TPA: folylpolyglutamate synthase/dihydrofolate synthase family protein [Thermomicrobiales bacterium]|nr:folylpolyglutamate synthase/dihydrofolate synthase family protein [Thermomicrobiales bacterium]
MTAEDNVAYRQALQAIWDRSAYDRGFVSNPFAGDAAADLGLLRTAEILRRLGEPQERYGIIHVAGSKGKGSTSAFAASILHAAGYRTGLYTSPHLHSYRERIAVDGNPIGEDQFAALTSTALAATAALERDRPDLGEVTAFEMTTAMALRHFADAGCDLAVIEVGMGGTLDATNVVSPLVSVITALDFEHTRVLGDTIEEIAANKAGIIKPGRPVVVTHQVPGAERVIAARAEAAGSRMLLAERDWHASGTWTSMTVTGPWGRYDNLHAGLIGLHQVENAGAAIVATWLLGDDGFVIPESAARAGVAEVQWPGRAEVVDRPGEPRYLIDGAHTPASATALASTVAALADTPTVLVLAMMSDKDPAAILRALAPVTQQVIATTTRSPRALPAAAIADAARAIGLPSETVDNVRSALAQAGALAGPGGLVLITGSLTTVAEAREALGLATADPPVMEG